MKLIKVLTLSLGMTATVFAQSTSSELKELKDAIAAQQQQIQQLQQQVQSRDAAIQQLQQQVGQAQSAASQAQSAAQSAESAQQKASQLSADEFGNLQHEVTDLKSVSANTVEGLQDTQKRVGDLESPLAIHYKGVTITPGGFLAAETVWRQRAVAADVNTNLNAIPYPGANQAFMSEFYGSGRQSRMTWLIQGKLPNMNLTGYYEMDFLGAGVTSNNNQSNSYVMRQRQVWGQAALQNGWSFTGGQMWSLVTETKVGLDNRTEATPLTIDAQYTVGFSWARQYGFRVVKNFHNKMWFGFSVENSQETLTTHGNTANSFLLGSQGNAGGLYNAAINGCSTTLNAAGAPVTTCSNIANYSFNPSPDFVGKVAFQPGFGGHYEIFGVLTDFRNRIFPNAGAAVPSATGAFNKSTWTGGGGFNARWLFYEKHIEAGFHGLAGKGLGRYGTGGLSDVTINPFGAVAPINSYQALASLEYHNPKWDWYGYGGTEYAGRTAFLNSKGAPVGYGSPLFNNTGCGIEVLPSPALTAGFSPGSLSTSTRNPKHLGKGPLGFWYKPYNGPKGRLQMGGQYSYLTRYAWTGYGTKIPAPPGANPTAIDNMFFTSFRYYLP